MSIICSVKKVFGLGTGHAADEFLEKFQMAFDPPLIFGKLFRIFL